MNDRNAWNLISRGDGQVDLPGLGLRSRPLWQPPEDRSKDLQVIVYFRNKRIPVKWDAPKGHWVIK